MRTIPRLQSPLLLAVAAAARHAQLVFNTYDQVLLQSEILYEVPNVDIFATTLVQDSFSLSSANKIRHMKIPTPTAHSQQLWMHTSIMASVLFAGAFMAFIVRAVDVNISGMIFICGVLGTVCYGCLFTLSFDIVVEHGGNAAMSGMVIAGPVASNFVGSILGQLIEQKYHMTYRICMVMVTLLLGVNLVVFWFMLLSPGTSAFTLLLVRLVQGVLLGFRNFCRYRFMEEGVSESQIESAMLWEGIGNSIGLGIAPMMTALGEHVFNSFDFGPASTMAAATSYFPLFLILPCCSAIWNVKTFGKIEMNAEASCVPEVSSVPSGHGSYSKSFSVAILVVGFVIFTFQHAALQSIEVGTVFLLEICYDMDTKHIGLLTGVSLLAILPLAGVLGIWVGKLEESSQLNALRLFPIMSVFACFLFIPVNMQGIHRWLPILVGDTLIFGISLSTYGVASKYILLTCKGRLSWGIVSIITDLSFGARSTAGPLIRALIANSPGHHQLSYALAQISCAVCIAILYFAYVHVIQSHRKD